jgi:hypothetical protein
MAPLRAPTPARPGAPRRRHRRHPHSRSAGDPGVPRLEGSAGKGA